MTQESSTRRATSAAASITLEHRKAYNEAALQYFSNLHDAQVDLANASIEVGDGSRSFSSMRRRVETMKGGEAGVYTTITPAPICPCPRSIARSMA